MSAPGLTASARVRFVRRRVLDPGCGQCDDLLSYAVLAADGHEIGEVRGVRLVPWHRNAHPADPHFGVNWVAFDADGHMVSGSDGTDRLSALVYVALLHLHPIVIGADPLAGL